MMKAVFTLGKPDVAETARERSIVVVARENRYLPQLTSVVTLSDYLVLTG